MFRLDGMNALVTGASGGIGSAIAIALAKQGARVALSGSNGSKLRSFREQLHNDYGGEHVDITCDLSNTTQVEELIPATLDTLGGIAKKVYGDFKLWTVIFEANRDKISSPSLIRVGMELLIPKKSNTPAPIIQNSQKKS